jgi:hypothetical protein
MTGAAIGPVGCSSSEPGGSLTLTCRESEQKFDQAFSAAYASRSQQGFDVVMVSDDQSAAGSVRQIMHARVLWSPDRPIKILGPSTTNASLRWYVFSEDAGKPGLIEYTGTAMVMLDPSEETTKVEIRNASLSPVHTDPNLTDPIGRARFVGKVIATNDAAKVADLIGEMRATVASAKTPAAPAQPQASLGLLAP